MATIMNADKATTEFEALPEYVREAKPRPRETYEFASPKYQPEPEPAISSYAPEEEYATRPAKGDVLETLWPGVHHELGTSTRRPASFYLTLGFMAGAVISLAGVYIFSVVSPMVTSVAKPSGTAVISQKEASPAAAGTTVPSGSPQMEGDTMVPSAPVYEVQTGDTLAGIAFKNYKHCSPRLLDEICRVNNMKNANVLSMGQKLSLPTYNPRSAAAAIATTPNSATQ